MNTKMPSHVNRHLGAFYQRPTNGVLKKYMADKPTKTLSDLYDRTATITSQEEAYAYFDQLVEDRMEQYGMSKEEATLTEQVNIGYWSGYQSYEVAARMQQLFHCVHPIFGSLEEQKKLTPDEVFKMGQQMAEDAAKGKTVGFGTKTQPTIPDRFRFSNWLGDA